MKLTASPAAPAAGPLRRGVLTSARPDDKAALEERVAALAATVERQRAWGEVLAGELRQGAAEAKEREAR